MSEDDDQDPCRCSICLDPLKDPATIPCGHSYCMKCISGFWDQEDQKGEYSCPQCREAFTTRPVLKKNTTLAELVEKMKKISWSAAASPIPPAPAQCAEVGNVECDFCTEIKLTAVKSCLVCLVSLCQTHIEPHNITPALKNHKLVQASTRLEERICPQHNKLLEVFCRVDQKCICMQCTMEDHKGHDTVTPAVARKESELDELEKTRAEYLTRIQKREKELQEIRETVLEKLEQELAELRRGHAQLEKLSLEEDHILFLQSFQVLKSSVCKPSPSNTLSPHMSFEDLSNPLADLKSEVEELRKHVMTLSGEAKSVEMPVTREDFLKYSCALTLDRNTACRFLFLSEGNKRATDRNKKWIYPYHPDRFTKHAQVLCEQGFRRRVYWEVEVELDLENDLEDDLEDEESCVEIAIAYKSINTDCDFLDNEKSWSLCCYPGGCIFWHLNREIVIPIAPASTIGVYVDHRAGILSFYSVSDKMTLLHKVETIFEEPIYPGFYLQQNASVKLLS